MRGTTGSYALYIWAWECSNYRPITLLNMSYKICAIILNNRLTNIVESKIQDNQFGFRPNRSTVDSVFIAQQLFEKCFELNIELHNMFVDYSQAFDSVARNKRANCGISTNMRYPSICNSLSGKHW